MTLIRVKRIYEDVYQAVYENLRSINSADEAALNIAGAIEAAIEDFYGQDTNQIGSRIKKTLGIVLTGRREATK